MSSNQREPAGTENKEKYEATVLDFLDKEIAAVQPTQKKKEPQGGELDALVSDLLKQVITESEAPKDANRLILDETDLDFPQPAKPVAAVPEPQAAPPTAAAAASTSPTAKLPPIAVKAAKAEKAPKSVPGQSALGMLAPESALKKKLPVIAAAFAGLVLVVAAIVYFSSGSSDKKANAPSVQVPAPQAQPKPAAAPVAPASNTASAPVSAAKGKVATPPPVQNQKNQKPAPASNPQQESAQMKPAPPKGKPEPAPAVASNVTPPPPAREEKPVVAQPVQAQPAPAPSTPAVQKPAPTPAAETAASVKPAVPEVKPAPPESKPAPPAAPQVSAPAPQPAAAAPSAPKNVIAAEAISKASPVFPPLAVRSRASGSVVLELNIDEQGKVVKAKAVSGPVIFYEAAVAAAMKWRYKPASVGGANIPSKSTVTMDFKLK